MKALEQLYNEMSHIKTQHDALLGNISAVVSQKTIDVSRTIISHMDMLTKRNYPSLYFLLPIEGKGIYGKIKDYGWLVRYF